MLPSSGRRKLLLIPLNPILWVQTRKKNKIKSKIRNLLHHGKELPSLEAQTHYCFFLTYLYQCVSVTHSVTHTVQRQFLQHISLTCSPCQVSLWATSVLFFFFFFFLRQFLQCHSFVFGASPFFPINLFHLVIAL